MKKKMLIPIGITAAAAIGCAAAVLFNKAPKECTAYVYRDGEEIARLPLDGSSDGEIITVTGENGAENVIEVKNGRIHMKSASCPDQHCVNMGWRHRTDVPIVCLPNKVVIDIRDSSDVK